MKIKDNENVKINNHNDWNTICLKLEILIVKRNIKKNERNKEIKK